jgi:hypothetical protein
MNKILASEIGINSDADSARTTRQWAIRQIQRRHRFWITSVAGTLLMLVVVASWATTEYQNAHGWPTHGFSQSSGIPNAWNSWIIYPAILWALLTVDAWSAFLRRPIPEREIDPQAR